MDGWYRVPQHWTEKPAGYEPAGFSLAYFLIVEADPLRRGGFGPALRLRAWASNPIGLAGEFFFCSLWARRLAADPAFQADPLDLRSVPPAGEIGRPIAVRTFFEGPGGRHSLPTSDPPTQGLNAVVV